MVQSYLEFMRVNGSKIDELLGFITPVITQNTSTQDSAISGKIFVITGTLSKPRDSFKELIQSLGGAVSSAVSSKTDYLLCGDDAGSKLTKANELGIKVLSEDEFNELIKK